MFNVCLCWLQCVVIGLQSTGEARTLEQIDGKNTADLEDFISTAKYVVVFKCLFGGAFSSGLVL